jgi:polysaccharide biosynthesis transport protein
MVRHRLGIAGSPDLRSHEERVIRSIPAPARTLLEDPFSRFAETIRALKMSADARGDGSESQVIGLTSSLPQEGKSTVAVALAAVAGLVGAKVILVDCDLRNPALSLYLAPGAKAGLLEAMSGEASIESVVWREPSTGMDFLPAANVRGLSNTAQLLSTGAMRQLFDNLRRKYDYVVVDLSPLLPVVDVRATVGFVDFYFFIIEWGRTQFEIIGEALNSGPDVYKKTLGFALNKVNQNAIGRYYNYDRVYGQSPFLESETLDLSPSPAAEAGAEH